MCEFVHVRACVRAWMYVCCEGHSIIYKYVHPNSILLNFVCTKNHHQVALTAHSSFFLSLSLAIRPYHPSLLAGLLGNIVCPHRADVSFCGRSTLARPCARVHKKMSHMRSSLLLQLSPTCIVRLEWFARCEISGCTVAVLSGIAPRITSRQRLGFLCNSYIAFFYTFCQRPCGASI